jgi:23S rRNA pseudouridine2457 synthase
MGQKQQPKCFTTFTSKTMKKKHYHYKIYKPFGVLSQFTSGEERQLKKKRFLSEFYDFPNGTMPVGRLDEKSEGLLLLTTDGELSNKINGSGIEKEYIAQLDGLITQESLQQLQKGVSIGLFGTSYTTKPCLVKNIDTPTYLTPSNPKLRIGAHRPTSWINIILTEGKFRQIRKMTAAVGFPTVRLIRIRVGSNTLENMTEGAVLPVTEVLI